MSRSGDTHATYVDDEPSPMEILKAVAPGDSLKLCPVFAEEAGMPEGIPLPKYVDADSVETVADSVQIRCPTAHFGALRVRGSDGDEYPTVERPPQPEDGHDDWWGAGAIRVEILNRYPFE